ncbi:MAG: hypothetical protein WC889_02870 [Myxococcota bacterium]|jgi:hypothetical protein
MTQFLIALIVVAALFAIVSQFVAIPPRVAQIIWIVIAALLAIWAIRLLAPMLGLG